MSRVVANCTYTGAWPIVSSLTAGIDWLTVTARPGHRAEELYEWGARLVEDQAQEGFERRAWGWQRYQGWTSGQIAVGERPDGAILRLSGHPADAHFPGAVRLAGNIARCDLAVTVDGIEPGLDLAGLSMERVGDVPVRRGRPSEWRYIRTRAHGATLYLGSRQSSRYCRLYDKSAERDRQHLGGSWRYEVEYKGDVATRLARKLVEQRQLARSVSATVWQEFKEHGIPPVYPSAGTGLRVRENLTPSDEARKLAWLRTQVAPTVAWLRDRGRLADVLEALGLDAGTLGDVQ